REPAATEPAGRVQAPAGAARGRPGRRARRRPTPLVPAAARASRRGRRLARALPALLVGPPGRPRSPPRPKGLNLDGTLLPDGDGCLLVFTQTFEGRAAAPRLAAGWTICLGNLYAALDGRAPSPPEWPALHERYTDELGSDGTFARDGDTAVLRFERVLNRPT